MLTLTKESTVIPNPKPTRILEHGDRILCFGKLEMMRELVPLKTRRKRKSEIQLNGAAQ